MLAPFTKNSKQVLYIQIADTIMEYIKKENLIVGDKLPSERVLSDSLKTSRNSVREALRFLETQGIITVHTGIGSFIACDYSDRSVSLQFTQLNYQETLEIKTALEILLTGKLIDVITEEQLAKLDSFIEAMDCSGTAGTIFHETDLQFHKYLYELSPNSTLKNMITDILITLDKYWSQFGGLPDGNQSIQYHRDIVRGLRQKNIDMISKSYHDMLQYDIKLFTKHIKNNSL